MIIRLLASILNLIKTKISQLLLHPGYFQTFKFSNDSLSETAKIERALLFDSVSLLAIILNTRITCN